MEQGKYGNKPTDGGGDTTLVNVEDSSYSLVMGIHTEEWCDLPYTGLMFDQTSPKEFFQMYPNIDEPQEVFSYNKHNYNIMHVGDIILAASP